MLSQLIQNRSLVLTRTKQCLWVSIFGAVAWAIPHLVASRVAALSLSGAVLLLGVAALVASEIARIASAHRFRLLPPGRGTLGHRGSADNERLASLWELWTWRAQDWPGAIVYGSLLPEHRVFGWPRRLQVAGPKNDPRHVITIAGSQSGKGRGMLVPNLLRYRGSALVVDPKGQLAAITGNARGNGSARVKHSLGQDVYVIDPENIVASHPVKASFNPLSGIDETDRQAVRRAKIIAESLVPPSTSSDGNAEFFIRQARALLEVTILHVSTFEPESLRHLPHVRRLLTIGSDDDLGIIRDEFSAQGLACPVDGPVDAVLYMMSHNLAFGGEIQGVARRLLAAQDTQRADILGELANHISFIGTPGIQELLDGTAGPLVELHQLRERPTTVYVCMSNTSLQRQERNLLRMLIELAAVTLERVPKRAGDWPVLVAMDEFYSLGYLKSIDVGIGAFAGYGILLWPVVQSLSQLKEHYPKTWENLLANCRAQQYFGQLDPETHAYLSQRLAGFYSPTELASNVFSRDDGRQVVTFADRPATLLQLALYDRDFPRNAYDQDPYFS